MCEVEQIKTILDIKRKNNEPKLIDNMLDFSLIECNELECNDKELEPDIFIECQNEFCEQCIVMCDKCEDLFCEDCGAFEKCSDCDKMYTCNLHGFKFSCCTRFTVISLT